MFLVSAVCGPLAANCYLLAAAPGRECVIIDPGQEAAGPVRSLVERHHLTPAAVLATHGHLDHIADAAALADHYDVPVWIRSEDRHLLADPAAGLGDDFAAWLALALPQGLGEPARVELFDGHDTLDVAGLTLQVTYAPGHTAGSVLFTLAETPLVFTGDVLFAGSIGRTDLPGGDPATMLATLRGPVLALPDAARVLPGHGPESTMARERAANPYLQRSFLHN
ncbi:MAG: MBL fold metallo-hydrolase [Propionibacteriaceae bacterium]|jgi:glyoxylase-like metal-dependent hydrolase (beta-lactamase superfamily II)|nr:MBL fold metallo-hydrolase [Propionibacteriaceae bacterium]